MGKKYFFIVALLGLSNIITAQNNFVLHNFKAIPQNYMTNPAIENPSRFVLGFPALSSVNAGINNSIDFSNNLLQDDPTSDSLILNLGDLVASLGDKNRINFNVQEEILYAGFKVPKGFVSFGVSAQIDAGFNLDKELLELVWYGNADSRFMNKTADFSDMDLDITAYLQYHLGFSYDATEKLTLGTRLKYLVGLGSINFEKFDASITTQEDPISAFSVRADADVLINASFYGAPDILDSINTDDFDPMKYIFGSKNKGFAFDFGAQYSLNDRIHLSASIIDLGFINWNSDIANYAIPNATYTFNGVDLGSLGDDSGDDDPFQEVLDTLDARFNFVETNNAFKTTLATKFYLSGSYKLDDKSWVDLLLWGRSRGGNLQSAVSVGINRQFGNAFGLKANYSIVKGSAANIGLGMSLKLGALQFYVLSDNLLPVVAPFSNHSMTNVRFGLNINVWKKDKEIVLIEKTESDNEI